MSRHRNHRHELFAQALAAGKLRPEAMITAGYKPHRGNQNRMAQLPDVIARVKGNPEIRRSDRGSSRDRPRAAADCLRRCSLAAAIAQAGPEALGGAIPPILLVDIRLDGVLAKCIEMRLLDEHGALSALLRYDNAPDRPAKMDFSPAIPADFSELEQALRNLLADRKPQTNHSHHSAQQ